MRQRTPAGRVRPPLLALLLALAPSPAAADAPPGATLESLLDIARGLNPDYAAARLDARAATERIQPAGALPDPILRAELQNVTNQGSDASPNLLPGRIGGTKYTLIQNVPFWGKRDMRRDLAKAEARQADGTVLAAWADLAARIKTAYARYYVIARVESLTRETLALTQDLEQFARTRYANGLAPQQDAIRAQVEQTAIRGELVRIETEHHHAVVTLNALLNRPSTAPLADPEALRPLPPPDRLDPAALEERLRGASPQLVTERARIDAAARNRELVRRNRYPDFNLGVSPIQSGSRISEWGLMIELNIPLQQQTRRSQEREAEARVDAAEARRDAAQNRLFADLAQSLSELEAARRLESLARDNRLPQAQVTFKAALAGYENGKLDFATLLDAQRQIRAAKLDTLNAQLDAQTRLADIERLIGEDL